MRKTIIGVVLSLALLFFLKGSLYAQINTSPTPAGSVLAAKVDYTLAYPGLLPDHPLYSLKVLRDRLMDFFIRDPLKKTEFLILMADKRLGAGKALIEGAKVDLGESTISKGENYLERAINSLTQARQQGKEPGPLLDKLEKSVRKHIEVLQEVLSKAPTSAQPGLRNALENAQKGYQRVLELKRGK